MFATRRLKAGGGSSSGAYACEQIDDGQTSDYTPAYAGTTDASGLSYIARNYTTLTTGSQSGTTNITVNSKTDVHTNNTVIDQNTGLEWSRDTSRSIGPSSDGRLYWTDANESVWHFVDAANAASLAGYTDWRLPNVNELASLMDTQGNGPDSTAFPAIIQQQLQSGNTDAQSTTLNLIMYTKGGLLSQVPKANAYYVLLVRG
jgi:hypothetical protein